MRVLYLTEASDRAEAGLMHGVQQRGHEVLVLGTAAAPALAHISAQGTQVQDFRFSSRFDGIRPPNLSFTHKWARSGPS